MPDKATVTPLGTLLQEARAKLDAGAYQEAIDLLSRARKSGAARDSELEELHYCIGVTLRRMGRGAEALPHLRKSQQLAESAGDASGAARSLEHMGPILRERAELREAELCYGKALKTWERIEDKAGQARAQQGLGDVLVDKQSHPAAHEAYAKARELYRELDDSDGVAACVISTATLRYRDEGVEAAVEEYRRALTGGGCEHYLLLNNIGFLLMINDTFDEARDYLERGKGDVEQRGIRDDNTALIYLNLGILEALSDRLPSAEGLLSQADTLFEQYPQGRAVEVLLLANEAFRDRGFASFLIAEDCHKLALTRLNLAVIRYRQGQAAEALELARSAAELDRDQPYPYLSLGWLHLAEGNQEEAIRFFRRAVGMEPQNEHFRNALELVNPYLTGKVGRNDACPCGSGKKFKKCHGKR